MRWNLREVGGKPPARRSGGTRLLGIPTVMDRLIQQALLQVLTPIFDPDLSPYSYGFRPRRRGHDAVRQARKYVEEGYSWIVDMDLEKFFDRVNHDILMARVARKVKDKRVLKLIRRYLQAGVMINGIRMASDEGTPQGGPLSPLLANILLDDLDRELEQRGHKFVKLGEPPYTERYVRWCERTGVNHPLLLNCLTIINPFPSSYPKSLHILVAFGHLVEKIMIRYFIKGKND